METRLDRTGVDAASGDLHSRSVCRDTLAIFGLPYVESNVMEHRMRANLRWESFPDRRFGGAMQGGSSSRLVPAETEPMDAAFQRGFYSTDVGACSVAGRGSHTDPRASDRRRRFARGRRPWTSPTITACSIAIGGPVVGSLAVCSEDWSITWCRPAQWSWASTTPSSDDGPPRSRRVASIGARPALRMDISSRQWSAMAVGHAAARDSPGRGASGHCHS